MDFKIKYAYMQYSLPLNPAYICLRLYIFSLLHNSLRQTIYFYIFD